MNAGDKAWHISRLSNEDTPIAMDLWRGAFDDSQGFVSWWFNQRYDPEQALGAKVGGQWVAMLHMPAYPLRLYGTDFRAACVAGVSTLPAYRNQGIAGAMLSQAVLQLAAQGTQMAFLYPSVSARVYRRLGFETAWVRQRYSLSASQLRPVLSRAEMLPLQPLTMAEAPQMTACFARAMGGRTGYVPRTDKDFVLKLSEAQLDGGLAGGIMSSGTLEGYALYNFEGGQIDVTEIAYANPQGRDALFAALFHQHGANALSCWLPEDDPLWLTLDDTDATAQTCTGGMLRVLDARALLEALPREHLGKPLHLGIQDDIIAQNSAVFRLAAGEPVTASKAGTPVDMEMDIKALAQLATGILSPERALSPEQGDGIHGSTSLWAGRAAVLFDYY